MNIQSLESALFATQLNYTDAEQKIRKSPEYDQLKQKLKSVEQVKQWKDRKLEIQIYSDRGGKGKRQIKEPICFENCTHVILDLYDILFKNDLSECNKCKKKPTKQNIKKEEFYKNIVSQLNEKAFYCSFYAGNAFHSYKQKFQPYANQLLSQQANEMLLEQIIMETNQREIEQNISQLIGKRVRHSTQYLKQIVKLPLHCPINAKKVIIPIMFKGCDHLECYEFTNLLKIIDENNKQIPQLRRTEVKCYYKDCENYITLNLEHLIAKKQIYFPKQLAEAINKDYSFALSVQWNYQMNKFVYDKNTINEQEQFRKIKNQLKEGDNHFTIFQALSQIVNKEISDDLENKFRFKSYDIKIQDIKYPCRCKKCPMNRCFDLITFIVQATQPKKDQKCQACQASFSQEQILDQIYFDKYLAQSIIERQENQNNQNLVISNKNQLAFKWHLTKYQTLTTNQVISLYLKNNSSNPYPKPLCSISNERMTQPIILPLCLNKRAFEFDKFSQYLEKTEFSFSSFQKDYPCPCQFCSSQKNFHLNMFYFDPVFQQLLSWFPEQWEKNVNQILIRQFQIDKVEIIKPKIIQKNPIPQTNYNNFFPENNQFHTQSYNNLPSGGNNQDIFGRNYSRPNIQNQIQQNQPYSQPILGSYVSTQPSMTQSINFSQMSPQQTQIERQGSIEPTHEYYLVNGELVPAQMYRTQIQKK